MRDKKGNLQIVQSNPAVDQPIKIGINQEVVAKKLNKIKTLQILD